MLIFTIKKEWFIIDNDRYGANYLYIACYWLFKHILLYCTKYSYEHDIILFCYHYFSIFKRK